MNIENNIIELKNEANIVKIHLHGATVISWSVEGKELLFLSSKALLDGSKPIRGGIPLVFRKYLN
jgi:glucose-6-phosphate 1-epimerase